MTKTKTNKLLMSVTSVMLAVGLIFSALILTGCSNESSENNNKSTESSENDNKSVAMSDSSYKSFVNLVASNFYAKWNTSTIQNAMESSLNGDKTEFNQLILDVKNIPDRLSVINPPAKYKEANDELVDLYYQYVDVLEEFSELDSTSSYDERQNAVKKMNEVLTKLSDFSDEHSELF